MIKKLFLFSPGQIFRYKSNTYRKFYYYFSRYFHLYTYFKRCYNIENTSKHKIENNKGYLILDNLQIPNSFYDEIDSIIKNSNLEKKIVENKKSIITINKNNFDTNSSIFKVIISKNILTPIINYLNCVPILSYLAIWYSPNKEKINDSSQFFHLDHEDYKQIKGFIFLEDIDTESGPLVIIDKKNSIKIQKKLKYKMTSEQKRIDDDTLKNQEKIILTGKKGTVVLLDTSSCLHFGSRKASKSRLLLSFQFITPFAFVLPWLWFFSEKTKIVKKIKHEEDLVLKIIGKKI